MKKNRNKIYGLTKEREAKKILEEEGWYVIRSRGSFGLFDMIAMNPVKGWKIVQVKATRQKKNVSYGKEIDEIRHYQVPYNTQKELWAWRTKEGWERIVIG